MRAPLSGLHGIEPALPDGSVGARNSRKCPTTGDLGRNLSGFATYQDFAAQDNEFCSMLSRAANRLGRRPRE